MQALTDDIENKVREREKVEYEESLKEELQKLEK